MRAIEYICPKCGLHTREMDVFDKHPVTGKPYEPTKEEMKVVIERMTEKEILEDVFATKWFYCPICDRYYTRFELKRVEFKGDVETYLRENAYQPFYNKHIKLEE